MCEVPDTGGASGGRPSTSRPVGDPTYVSVDCTNGSSGTEYTLAERVELDCGVSGIASGASFTRAGAAGRHVSTSLPGRDLKVSPTSVGDGEVGALLSVSPRKPPLPDASERGCQEDEGCLRMAERK